MQHLSFRKNTLPMFNRFLDPKNDFAFHKIFGQEKQEYTHTLLK